MEGQVSSLNAAAAGTVVLYEALRQRRRNVAPADTRTPRPAQPEAVTPQEEDMEVLDEADEQELEADLAADDSENGEPTESAEEEEAAADAPTKATPRAKKAAAPKKAKPRKKAAD
jgi:hypothetical protein